MSQTSKILVTMGDPLGIGPEVITKALTQDIWKKRTEFHVIGELAAFEKLPQFKKLATLPQIHFHWLSQNKKSQTADAAGQSAFDSLKLAVQKIKSENFQALVTAPISKENIRKAGFGFPGHTEYLCHEFKIKKYAMMLFHSRLRVVLVTIHKPLRDIFSDITAANIREKLMLTTEALRTHFHVKSPRIAVCGLNPHAGENGLLGAEEKKIITPAIRTFLRGHKNVDVIGPVSADTVFHEALKGRYDAVLCHYHDQGLIPLKSTGFEEGVNMTLGLPFLRTSPDHGTAFDIAGKNKADATSMVAALKAAEQSF